MPPGNYCLPDEIWCIIFEYLDAESLLAIERSDLLSWNVLAEWKLRRRVTLSPHSDAAQLEAFAAHVRSDDVDVLRLTDCLVMCPVRLLQCISIFKQLKELYCVNCQLSSSALFKVVAEFLPTLVRLEWSLFDEAASTHVADTYTGGRLPVTNVRRMYVEIAGGRESYAPLMASLSCCPRLDELHVHNTGANQLVAIDVFCKSTHHRGQIRAFTYTSREVDRRTMTLLCTLRWRGQRTSTDCRLSALLCGNVTYCMHPINSSNCLCLPEVMGASELSDRSLQQVVLCVKIKDDAPTALSQAARGSLWCRLKALTIALVPPYTIQYIGSPYIGPEYTFPLTALFAACSVLTELNLNLVHFTADIDCCEIIATAGKRQLRAISLAPCGMQSTESVCRLAVSCPILEELDVRGFHDVFGLPCDICRSPFQGINEETMAVLHQETRLHSLGLHIFGMRSLDFLVNCRVQRLQVCWCGKGKLCSGHRSIGQLLSVNPYLRSLTFACSTVALKTWCSELDLGARTLQRLCIVSSVREARESTKRVVLDFARSHPSLEIVHAHYVDEDRLEQRITWIRRWRDDLLELELSDGAFLSDAPCILDCCLSTFIGLKKPHN
ncbi:uncharacterized protein LOC144170180 [Haemaphysalis longicornis]